MSVGSQRRGLLIAVLALGVTNESTAQQPITVTHSRATDSLTVIADIYRASVPSNAPAILLFHQGGGDARGEYGRIIPVLLREGLHVVAADSRGGGVYFGEHRGGRAPRVSLLPCYRRCQHDDGPGARERTDGPAPLVQQAGIPLLVLRPASEVQDESRRLQYDRFLRQGIGVYIAENGAHGSSMLVASRVQGDASPQWSVVLDFLRAARTPPPARHPDTRPLTPLAR